MSRLQNIWSDPESPYRRNFGRGTTEAAWNSARRNSQLNKLVNFVALPVLYFPYATSKVHPGWILDWSLPTLLGVMLLLYWGSFAFYRAFYARWGKLDTAYWWGCRKCYQLGGGFFVGIFGILVWEKLHWMIFALPFLGFGMLSILFTSTALPKNRKIEPAATP